MATRKKRIERRQRRHEQRKATHDPLSYRSLGVRAGSLNEKDRSIEALIATETPVNEFDYERGEMVHRVLLTQGAILPTKQVPFLDSHNRFSVQHVIGSGRGLKKTDEGVLGRLFFSSTAEDEFTKVREGHVTDVSAGFVVHEETHIPAGQRQKIKGREFEGPVNVATKWELREVSLVPIGADDQAKMRGLDPNNLPTPKRGFVMNEQLRALCVERGMDDKLSDDDAQQWLVDNNKRVMGITSKTAEPARDPLEDVASKVIGVQIGLDDDAIRELVDEHLKAADEKRETYRADVDGLLEISDVADTDGLRAECYELGDITKVRERILKIKADRNIDIGHAPVVNLTGEGRDRHLADLGTALTMRCLQNTGAKQENIDKELPEDKRAKGYRDFDNASLYDMARESLMADGFSHRELSSMGRERVSMAALGFFEQAGVQQRAAALHTTGSFAVLTQDAMNKSMQVGYTEFPATWQGPMRQAASVADFKTIHRMRLGAIPNLPIWPDNSDPEQSSLKDAEETYAVEAYSTEVSFSYRLIINDDMDTLSRIPFQLGNAASRTVNAAAWAQLTGNPIMEDGQTLLLESPTGNRKRTNWLTEAATPTVSTVGVMKKNMRLMRGENTPEQGEGDDILNLEPVYLIAPAALETTVLQLILSIADPAASGNSGIHNPTRNLIPIIEPRLDAALATTWYLFASPSQIDTIEVTFLQGQETPVPRSWLDDRKLAQSWAIVQSFAAKVMNHRGIQGHKGAT